MAHLIITMHGAWSVRIGGHQGFTISSAQDASSRGLADAGPNWFLTCAHRVRSTTERTRRAHGRLVYAPDTVTIEEQGVDHVSPGRDCSFDCGGYRRTWRTASPQTVFTNTIC
jgi:hypothetical protein